MSNLLKRLIKDERGATAIEYGLICALMFLAIVGSVMTFGEQMTAIFEKIDAEVIAALNR